MVTKKIGINATILDGKPTGVGTFTKNIVRQMDYLTSDLVVWVTAEYLKRNYFFIDYSKSQPLGEVNYMLPPTWDIAKAPFQVRTVIYSAIQLAAYMGCKKIYLLGCDHDYLHDMQRVTNHHFYREEDGVSDAEHLSAFTTERWLEEYYFRWKQYRLMREYLKSIDCDIYNSTQGGMLDVFPRVPLCEAVEHPKIDY